ncbi:MAG: hypothetical protein JW754_00700, partial [Candidatus Aenigmarchaeota archaeon]|nr:hypothetical protein [Candidatus Aenigmarchaeota archaeon]
IRAMKEERKLADKRITRLENIVNDVLEEMRTLKKHKEGLDIDKFIRIDERVRKTFSKVEDRFVEIRNEITALKRNETGFQRELKSATDNFDKMRSLQKGLENNISQINKAIQRYNAELSTTESLSVISKQVMERIKEFKLEKSKIIEEIARVSNTMDSRLTFIEGHTQKIDNIDARMQAMEKGMAFINEKGFPEGDELIKEAFTDLEDFKNEIKKEVDILTERIRDLKAKIGDTDEADNSDIEGTGK